MGRLFWKFFLFISLAQLTALFGVGAVIWIENAATRKPTEISFHPRAAFFVDDAAQALVHGGPEALRAVQSQTGKPVVYVLDASGHDVLGRRAAPQLIDAAHTELARHGSSAWVRQLTANGTNYLLFAPAAPFEGEFHSLTNANRWHGIAHRIRLLPLVTTLVGSLLCAAVLAGYLSRPIRNLRDAFHRASNGYFEQRVAPLMANRRDELANLGRDFDRMADQLQSSIASQRNLIHHVSHELRSPLARLDIAVGLARQEPESLQAALDRIELESARIDALVGELLTMSRLETGAIDAMDDRIDLAEVVGEAVDDAQFEARRDGRTIATTFAPDLPVVGNAELLHRAIDNIVRNAMQHTPRGTDACVTVAATDDGCSARVIVQDFGSGVRANELDKIFQPFVRGSNAVGRDGHGLGLSIAKQIVEAHGGRIDASNTKQGGLRVEIVLPLARMAAENSVTTAENSPPSAPIATTSVEPVSPAS